MQVISHTRAIHVRYTHFWFLLLMQFHAKFQDSSWCPNGARSEKTMLHRVMDTNNKIRKKPVFTGFLRIIYAALCGDIRGFSRFTPLEIELSERARGFESHRLRHNRNIKKICSAKSPIYRAFLLSKHRDFKAHIRRCKTAVFALRIDLNSRTTE